MRFTVGLACVLIATAAQADVVHFVDGRSVEGESRWTAAGVLEVRLAHGSMRIAKDDVLRIGRGPTASDGAAPLARRALLMGERDLAATLLLAAAAQTPGRDDVAELLQHLDYARLDGAWRSPRARGLVWIGGKWRTKARARQVHAARTEARLQKEARRAEHAVELARERLERAEATERTALKRVEDACLQDVHTNKEHAAKRRLLVRDARLRQTAQELRAIRKAIRAQEQGECPHGACLCDCCGPPPPECDCEEKLFANYDRRDALERQLAARRDARAAALTRLRETIEPTRITVPAARLRLAEKRTAAARLELRRAKAAERQAKANLVTD